MRLPLRESPWLGNEETRRCPVCRQSWTPYAGSLLPCHARCLLTEQEQDLILKRLQTDPTAKDHQLAKEYGVPLRVVHSSFSAAARRRRKAQVKREEIVQSPAPRRAAKPRKRAAPAPVKGTTTVQGTTKPGWFSVEEAAKRSGVKRSIVAQWVREGRLPTRGGFVELEAVRVWSQMRLATG